MIDTGGREMTQAPSNTIPNQSAMLRRLQVEDFLYAEAAILDEWRLSEWLDLFTDDAMYVVPATDLPDGDPWQTLTVLTDDMARLRGRVTRLMSRHAYREFPYARTRRLITNVRITGEENDTI